MIEIEINGKKYDVEPGSMIIEVADKAGIPIPRFCYHKKLSVAANCRMCLVDVEKSGKPLPACATPVTPDMVIRTNSAKALEAQKAVMEFLLINHPLDCPICDQGGQCELQDVAMAYGRDSSRYDESKRSVEDENLGSLVATEMTRCIQCTRCVRFGDEVAGIRELGIIGRGEKERIGTYADKPLKSELSGNIIDICPVGALTSRPFAYSARAWELEQHESIAPHDCVGSNIFIHARRGEVMRVVPKENEALNQSWLSDRDRFAYQGLGRDHRVVQPLIKKENKWCEVTWPEALHHVVERLQRVKSHHGPAQMGGLISASATIEEQYLWQKLLRDFGCQNIDHRVHQLDYSYQDHMPLKPGLAHSILDLEQQEVIFLIGSDTRRQQAMLNLRIREASLNGAKTIALNMLDGEFNFKLTENVVCPPAQMIEHLSDILQALTDGQSQTIADVLKAHQKVTIIVGEMALNHPQSGTLMALAGNIAKTLGIELSILTEGANAAGAWLAGCVSHRGPNGTDVTKGLDALDMIENKLNAYCLFNIEPELDCANSAKAVQAMANADFVVSFSPFKGGVLNAHADVILPIAPFSENNGSYVNCEGLWQHFRAAVNCRGASRPGWKVLRVLANLLKLSDFDYLSSQDVREALEQELAQTEFQATEQAYERTPATQTSNGLQRITRWPMYRGDNLVRRASALQKSGAAEMEAITINHHLAERLQVVTGDRLTASQKGRHIELPVIVDNKVPNDCVYIPSGFKKTVKLFDSFGEIELLKTEGAAKC